MHDYNKFSDKEQKLSLYISRKHKVTTLPKVHYVQKIKARHQHIEYSMSTTPERISSQLGRSCGSAQHSAYKKSSNQLYYMESEYNKYHRSKKRP